MLKHLGEGEAGDRVERAIAAVTAEGEFLTGELGGSAATDEVGTAIARAAKA
jgi:isocitrate dehydrogenase (NAD+)